MLSELYRGESSIMTENPPIYTVLIPLIYPFLGISGFDNALIYNALRCPYTLFTAYTPYSEFSRNTPFGNFRIGGISGEKGISNRFPHERGELQ